MENTKERILEAALRLFHEYGYRGATTAEIARQAGVAEGTIYRYFKEKKELFLACVEPVIEEAVRRELSLSGEGSPRERMRRRVIERYRVIRENLAVFHILFTESRYHPEIARMLLAQVAARVADEERQTLRKAMGEDDALRRPPNPLIMSVGVTAAIWSMVSASELSSEWPPPVHYADLENEVADFVCHALFRDETV
ncbi:MAG: TetR/AcrR family transcriptional regulator [Bacillota bacterium]